jgi:hypothetical protein
MEAWHHAIFRIWGQISASSVSFLASVGAQAVVAHPDGSGAAGLWHRVGIHGYQSARPIHLHDILAELTGDRAGATAA